MQSQAKTVDAYLAEQPADRRAALAAVRKVILANLDKRGYEEGMTYGMIGYYIPHRIFPAGYHCDPKQPVPFVNLGSQKNHMSLHMMGIYGDSPHAKWFTEAWAKTGKKLDMGKACVRFKKLEDLALDVIGESVRRIPAKKYLEVYQRMLGSRKPAPESKAKPVAGKRTPAKKAPASRKRRSVARAK